MLHGSWSLSCRDGRRREESEAWPALLLPADIFALTFPGHSGNSLPPRAQCQPPL